MGDKENNSGLKKFFQENRTLVFTIPVFIILVIAVILVYVLSGRDTVETTDPPEANPTATVQPTESTPAPTDEPTDADGTEVTTLPDNERDKDKSEIMRNPFADPYKVSGIIYDKSGSSIAIIEAENKTYIVETGDQVGEYFKVLSIESDRVVLEINNEEVVLLLAGQ